MSLTNGEKIRVRNERWRELGWEQLDKRVYRFSYDMNWQGTAICKKAYDANGTYLLVRELFVGDAINCKDIFDELTNLPFIRETVQDELGGTYGVSYLWLPDVEIVRDIIERLRKRCDEFNFKRGVISI